MIRLANFFALTLILVVGVFSLHSCHLPSAYTNVRQAQLDIEKAEKGQVLEEGLYHLAAAKRLLEAAEKEYEEADFGEASKLALEARTQAELAMKVSRVYSGE